MMQLLQYYVTKQYPKELSGFFKGYIPAQRPRREWDVYNGDDGELPLLHLSHQQLQEAHGDYVPEHWAEPSLHW